MTDPGTIESIPSLLVKLPPELQLTVFYNVGLDSSS